MTNNTLFLNRIVSVDKSAISKKKKHGSLLIALIIMSKMLNILVGTFVPSSFPTGATILGLIWIFFLLYALKYYDDFNVIILCLSLFVITFFLISIALVDGDHTSELFVNFIEYGLLGLLAGNCKFSVRKILEIFAISTFICFVPTIIVFRNSIASINSISMPISYHFFPMFAATILHMFFYHQKKYLLSYVFSIGCIIFILLKGTRGIAVSFIALVFLIFFIKSKRLNNSKFAKYFICILAILTIVVIASNIETLIVYADNLLSRAGINIKLLQDSIDTIQTKNDITDGRTYLYSLAFSGFLKSPIFGNGIGSFNNITPLAQYPHNGILQLMFEGGLLLSLPIIMVLIISTFLFLKCENNLDYRIIFAFLFCAAFIPSLFSDEIWLYQSLWFLIGYSTYFFFMRCLTITKK